MRIKLSFILLFFEIFFFQKIAKSQSKDNLGVLNIRLVEIKNNDTIDFCKNNECLISKTNLSSKYTLLTNYKLNSQNYRVDSINFFCEVYLTGFKRELYFKNNFIGLEFNDFKKRMPKSFKIHLQVTSIFVENKWITNFSIKGEKYIVRSYNKKNANYEFENKDDAIKKTKQLQNNVFNNELKPVFIINCE